MGQDPPRAQFYGIVDHLPLMGAGAALIAALAGTLASWALVVGAMQAEWVFLPGTLAITVLGATVLTVVLGLIGTYSALRAPSAPGLRTE